MSRVPPKDEQGRTFQGVCPELSCYWHSPETDKRWMAQMAVDEHARFPGHPARVQVAFDTPESRASLPRIDVCQACGAQVTTRIVGAQELCLPCAEALEPDELWERFA